MKKLIALSASLIVVIVTANSQDIVKHAPAGFDSLRTEILHGKIDSISYPGGHTWPVWRNNLYNFAQLLFK